MRDTYGPLRRRAKALLLKEWMTEHPTHPYYAHPPNFSPHPFMGQGKFVAGRIHQMRARKSYLATHQSWFDQDEPTTCPRCYQEDKNFEHSILKCPAHAHDMDLLLKGISSVDPSTPLWFDNAPLQAQS